MRRRLRIIVLLSAAVHLFFFTWVNFAAALLQLFIVLSPRRLNRWKTLFLLTAAEAVFTAGALFSEGLLHGFSVPLLFSIPVLFSVPHPPGLPSSGPVRERIHTLFSAPAAAGTADALYRFLRIAAVLFFGLCSLLILYLLFSLSFSRGNIVSYSSLVPPFPSAASYRKIFTEHGFLRALLNTFLIALPAALIIPLLTVPGAYGLSRVRKERSDRWLVIMQTLGTSGGIHTLIPLFTIVGTLGLLDNRAAVIFLYVGHSIPRSTMILKSFFQDIPDSLYETAAIEGCRFREFLRLILLPLSLPAVTAVVMTSFLGAWNGFLVPLLFLGSETKYPVSITLFRFVGSGDSGSPLWSLFAAAAVVDLLVVGGLFFLVKRPLSTTHLSEYHQ